MAKRYFAENSIPYEEADVSQDRAALKEMVTNTGQYGVPVIVVGDKAMVGWGPAEFKRLWDED